MTRSGLFMNDKKGSQKHIPNSGLMAAGAVLFMAICLSLLFDHYYEFNDDVLIKDILSGQYTGTPSGLNIQMLSPLGYLLSLPYRISRGIPWYGIFLSGVQYISVFFIIRSFLNLAGENERRLTVCLVCVLSCLSFLAFHLVMLQYTVTVFFMAACACVYLGTYPFTTSKGEDGSGGAVRYGADIIFPGILIVMGFMLRSEMMLLMMPFILYAWLISLGRGIHLSVGSEDKRANVRSCVILAAAVFACFGLSLAADRLSYSSPEWRAFREEFDARTRLYDYSYVPGYEENRDFYDSIGLSAEQVKLLEIYDYGLDTDIDADVLNSVAEYGNSLRRLPPVTEAGYVIRNCIDRMLPEAGHPDSFVRTVMLLLYMALAAAVLLRKNGSMRDKLRLVILKAGGLILLRSVCWIYIIHGRREPDRITHPLYLMELMVLLMAIATELHDNEREGRAAFMPGMAICILLAAACLFRLPSVLRATEEKVRGQSEINVYAEAIDAYAKAHPECFYWEDVYSTIIEGETFNERIFAGQEKDGVKNYDLIGGWAMNSPLLREKTAAFGIENISDDILESDSTFIIIEDTRDTDWIISHYAESGIEVRVIREDSIAGRYGVYSVRRETAADK